MDFLSKIKLLDETNARQIIDTRLPTFTSADNGKILVIKNGSWALGENSGESFTPEVLLTTDAIEDATFWATCESKTVNPIYQGDYKYLFSLPNIGTWTIHGKYEPSGEPIQESSTLVEVTKIKRYKTSLDFSNYYGVEWLGTSDPKFVRTGKAASFSDPVPYVSGMTAAQCHSPFDNIMPWSGMQKIEHPTVGTLVSIPKFWYRLYKPTGDKGIGIQIANEPLPGFYVSPAHIERGDGLGERDVFYLGRYKCIEGYYSRSGSVPLGGQKRSVYNTGISGLGIPNVVQQDYISRFVLQLLYLVEFANWNSQACIGFGVGLGASGEYPIKTGSTDSMPYHTGTMQTSRDQSGIGIQYRNIENLWDNGFEYLEGNLLQLQKTLMIGTDAIAHTTPYTIFTQTSGKFPTDYAISMAPGFPIFYPSVGGGAANTYGCDFWNGGEDWPYDYVYYTGANSTGNAQFGLFYFNHTYEDANPGETMGNGCRLMVISPFN